MIPSLAAPILPPGFVSQASANILSIVAIALSAILLATVVLILCRHASSARPLEPQSHNDSFDQGGVKK